VAAVLFFIAGIGVIAGAMAVVTLRNPFYSVLGLVVHLVSLAALFLLLRAEFVAAAQVIVYAGAVMVLYVFVVSYVGLQDEPWRGTRVSRGGASLKVGATLFCGAVLVELCIAVLGSGLRAIDSRGAGYVPGFGSPAQIGDLLLTKFLFAFEVASFLLLIAAVGAVVLARRRGGLDGEAETLTVAALLRVPGLGSMAEGVGSTAATPSRGDPDREPEPQTAHRRDEPFPWTHRGGGPGEQEGGW
jgi:NADH:ubiquinone oxidoreductase subunit 6 (subunit J)